MLQALDTHLSDDLIPSQLASEMEKCGFKQEQIDALAELPQAVQALILKSRNILRLNSALSKQGLEPFTGVADPKFQIAGNFLNARARSRAGDCRANRMVR